MQHTSIILTAHLELTTYLFSIPRIIRIFRIFPLPISNFLVIKNTTLQPHRVQKFSFNIYLYNSDKKTMDEHSYLRHRRLCRSIYVLRVAGVEMKGSWGKKELYTFNEKFSFD